LVGDWKQRLLAAAEQDKDVKFPTPSEETFQKRLAAAAEQYDFRILSVHFVRAPQGAPLALVEADSPTRFARDVPAIVSLIDPKTGGEEDWQGWDYEGFFLGAQDDHGEPSVAVFNYMRDHGGGQWSSREDTFPYPHG
jgi:hypothetical protein